MSTQTVITSQVRSIMGRTRTSQKKLGEIVGLSQPAIASRLDGSVAWRIDELDAICAHFDIPVSYLITPSEVEFRRFGCTRGTADLREFAEVS